MAMWEFLTTAILFYVLGRIAGREEEVGEKANQVLKKFKGTRAGVYESPTLSQTQYETGEEIKADRERLRVVKEAGIL